MTCSRLLPRLALALALAAACGDPSRETPPVPGPAERAGAGGTPAHGDAGFVAGLRRLRAVPAHVSDGGGRVAWAEAPGEPVHAVSGVARGYRLVYEAGPHGIAVGGVLVFEVSPYWGWSKPQIDDPEAPGFTTLESAANGVELHPQQQGEHKIIRVGIRGRALAAGETITLHYGAGPAGVVARFAEKRAGFRFGVDGDGDGSHAYLADVPRFEVRPGPAATLVVTVPATARPGESFAVHVSAVDERRNVVESVTGEFRVQVPAGVEMKKRFSIGPEARGHARIEAIARSAGVVRLSVVGPGGLRGWSNPLDVSDDERVLWGDLHGHTAFSDGTGEPTDYFRFARDVAGLDVSALTDHDSWGPVPLDRAPKNWQTIQAVTRRFHAPGRFVTILGYEWTNWEHGHRHVLYFDDEGEVYSALDRRFDTPPLLWKALAGRSALTFAHHSAGGPVATNWDFAPDPVLEPVTEISSVHGSSEAPDSPSLIDNAVAGNFVRDALDRGYDLGFIGSGDSHDGHPGAVPMGRPPGGLAGILSEDLTRAGVLEALRARRVYATNGPRIVLRAELAGYPMGATLPLAGSDSLDAVLDVRVVAPRKLARVDLVRSGALVETVEIADKTVELSLQRDIRSLRAGEYLYVRVVQKDGGAAWSSPFFVED